MSLGLLLKDGANTILEGLASRKQAQPTDTEEPAGGGADMILRSLSQRKRMDDDEGQSGGGDMSGKSLVDMALDGVAGFEGGYVNDPDDPGGETNKGITLKFLKQVEPGADSKRLKSLTADDARQLMRTHFVEKPGIDKLPPVAQAQAVALSVNAGAKQAIRVLQRAAGVEADGIIGPKTIAAVGKMSSDQVKDAVDDFYIGLVEDKPQLSKYLRGWLNRSAGMARIG